MLGFAATHRGFVLAAITAVLVAFAAALLPAANPSPACAWADGQPLTLDYPRLGMWWPDTERQPLSAIARYDWVILGPWDEGALPALRQKNPDIILLNSTNACELSFNPDAGAEPWENEELARVPAQWLLTQVGAELSRPASASATTLHVSRVRAAAAGVTHRLFVAGDCAVVGGELVRVKRVDVAAGTLVVRRGVVWPAAPHAAGTRAAATVSFWPGSLLLDQSTYCPAMTVDDAVGPETWADYNARLATALVAGSGWDGLLVDRSDGDQSWLIGNSTARTIDPDRSNTLVDDDYAAFDNAWNAGLRRFEERLRAGVGDKIIYVNWGYPNYDLLNGNNFEGFPMADTTAYGLPWSAAVFGPKEAGSYFDWLSRARQPNLTMVETYEDDGGPAATSDGSYDNPASHPGFAPNYRKVRFGLCTALLGDGFFSYEINTNGHGSLGLFWMDEYDAAGRGRGYLGQPLGPATRAVGELRSANLAAGGSFESPADLAGWDWWTEDGYAGAVTRDEGTAAAGASSVRLDVTQTLGTDWRASLTRERVALRRGADYTLCFWAKADRPRSITVWAQQNTAPWVTWLDFGEARLSTEWQEFEITAPCGGDDTRAALSFGVGQSLGTVWLDGIRLQKGSRDVWRRNYQGGAVLLNATAGVKSVSLGGTYKKLRGRQAPAINDGSYVTQVRLPARDGLIVLNATAEEATAARSLDTAVAEWAACARRASQARAWYAGAARRAAGSARAPYARARDAWARAQRAAAGVRVALAAARTALRAEDFALAKTRCTAAAQMAAPAAARVRVAWRAGHATASRAAQARRHAADGVVAASAASSALAVLP